MARPVAAEGYTTPTPIQTKAIPEALAGKDVLVATPGRVGDADRTAESSRPRADSEADLLNGRVATAGDPKEMSSPRHAAARRPFKTPGR